MRLYTWVWDYGDTSCGAIAESEADARALIAKHLHPYDLNDFERSRVDVCVDVGEARRVAWCTAWRDYEANAEPLIVYPDSEKPERPR